MRASRVVLTLQRADAFDAYQTVTGAVLDSATGLLRLTPDQFANLQSLFFQIGDVSAFWDVFSSGWP